MNWKRLRPYILEMMVFLAAATVIAGLVLTETIIFRWSILLVLIAILTLLWCLNYLFGFVPFAVLVISDFLLKRYETVDAEVVEQFEFRSSSFLDRNGKSLKNGRVEQIRKMYNKVVVKTGNGISILTSSERFDMEPNVKYRFVFGKRSKALVDVRDVHGRSL